MWTAKKRSSVICEMDGKDDGIITTFGGWGGMIFCIANRRYDRDIRLTTWKGHLTHQNKRPNITDDTLSSSMQLKDATIIRARG